jgi:hypothetical protein
MPDTITKPRASPFAVLRTALPIAAAAVALACGGVVVSEAVAQVLAQGGTLSLARYAFVLTHLTIGAGLLFGGAITLGALRRRSDALLLAGQLVAIACFGGMLAMQTLSLWDIAGA